MPLIYYIENKEVYNMPARKPNSVNEYVRRAYVGLDEENFEQYHNIVSKLRGRAKARGFDPGNLTQEQFDIINNDNLPELERGEKFHLSWENSSMGKGLIEDAIEYLTPKQIKHYKVEDSEDLTNWMIVPSAVKLAARGLKEENDFLLQASHLNPNQINLVKDKMQAHATNFIIKNVEEIL